MTERTDQVLRLLLAGLESGNVSQGYRTTTEQERAAYLAPRVERAIELAIDAVLEGVDAGVVDTGAVREQARQRSLEGLRPGL